MRRDWWHWLLGFVAGSVLATYVALSCSPTGAQSVPELIDQAAAWYGAPEWVRQRAHAVIWCESRYQNVPNRQGSGASGPAQFMPRTFYATAPAAGFPGASIWDPVANVFTALYLMVRGEWWHWRACW
jgi:hypothetical protein